MVKLKGGYSAIIDGQDVILKGIHKFPDEIKKELIEKKFAEEVLEDDITPRELAKVRTIFLVDGKLTEKEPVAEKSDIQEPVNANGSEDGGDGSEDGGDGSEDDLEITFESLMEMKVEDIKALAKEKGLELKATKKEDLAKEFVEILGA